MTAVTLALIAMFGPWACYVMGLITWQMLMTYWGLT